MASLLIDYINVINY